MITPSALVQPPLKLAGRASLLQLESTHHPLIKQLVQAPTVSCSEKGST